MSNDFTEQQSDDGLRKARQLSVEPTRPPARIEGYTIQSFIGRGSYGEVWSAIDQKTGKRVAIKFYAQRSSVDVKQLAQEVEKLVLLAADRYVVQLLDVGWSASPPYYVMDYIEYGSLEDLLNSDQSIQVSRAVKIFEDVAIGLMHLHGKGILHCDLKPGNVLLDQDGNPRLADFGQSRLQTDSSSALGTLFFMAPEQADLRSMPDAKWDVYGLGAILYTMLTGKPPYYSEELKKKIESAESLHDRLKLYRNSLNSAAKPRKHRRIPGVDRGLADVIDRCVAANPSERFASAQSVIEALRMRNLKRVNQPLKLLGVMGPVLLLTLISVFGLWAFRQAKSDANEAIIAKSEESNQFAAQLAARSASEQLDEYFRVVKQLARNEEFRKRFELADERLAEMRQQLADPNKNDDSFNAQVRQNFRSHPARQALQPLLQKRLDDPDDEFPEAASWFATDRFGNQMAGAFDSKKFDTIGKNYSYRSYFTGENWDTENDAGVIPKYPVATDPAMRTIIDKPHLSASFLSQASGLQKVAFSAPIRSIKTDEIIGIVAITVNLGSLVDFKNSLNHYVMLVDDRPRKEDGKPRGIVLEHPLFLSVRSSPQISKLPEELINITIDTSELVPQKPCLDPMGKTSLGPRYNRRFIVSKSPVKQTGAALTKSKLELRSQPDQLETDSTETETAEVASPEVGSSEAGFPEIEPTLDHSGLLILAFDDYESVIEPAEKLSRRLGRLALLALSILVAVAVGMWFLVSRLFRESGLQLFGTGDGDTATGSLIGGSSTATGLPSSKSTAKGSTKTGSTTPGSQ
jgi:serine/threonine protein kinase